MYDNVVRSEFESGDCDIGGESLGLMMEVSTAMLETKQLTDTIDDAIKMSPAGLMKSMIKDGLLDIFTYDESHYDYVLSRTLSRGSCCMGANYVEQCMQTSKEVVKPSVRKEDKNEGGVKIITTTTPFYHEYYEATIRHKELWILSNQKSTSIMNKEIYGECIKQDVESDTEYKFETFRTKGRKGKYPNPQNEYTTFDRSNSATMRAAYEFEYHFDCGGQCGIVDPKIDKWTDKLEFGEIIDYYSTVLEF